MYSLVVLFIISYALLLYKSVGLFSWFPIPGVSDFNIMLCVEFINMRQTYVGEIISLVEVLREKNTTPSIGEIISPIWILSEKRTKTSIGWTFHRLRC